MDIDNGIQAKAKSSINNYNLYNISFINEDVFSNWIPKKKYDVIVLTGSTDTRVEKLEDSLNQDGRMFVVTGNYPVMDVNIIRRVSEKKLIIDQAFETTLDPLKNIYKKSRLNF